MVVEAFLFSKSDTESETAVMFEKEQLRKDIFDSIGLNPNSTRLKSLNWQLINWMLE